MQGHVLRSGSRHEDGSLHVYGHGSPRAKADGDVLRGRARDAASDGNLQVQVPTYRTVATQLYGLRSGLDRQDGAVHGMVPSCETRQGTRCETHCVPVKETRMHCVDKGHWEDRPVSACNCLRSLPEAPDRALLGTELGERAGGSDGQQAGDGPGALHVPGPGLQAPDSDPHGQGLPL